MSAHPRAWLVSKADMHGNLYDALAWDNGGKPLGVSVNTPVPMYDDAAIREMIVAIQNYREAIRRTLEAWDTTTNSKSHDGRLWQCMEELRMEIEK